MTESRSPRSERLAQAKQRLINHLSPWVVLDARSGELVDGPHGYDLIDALIEAAALSAASEPPEHEKALSRSDHPSEISNPDQRAHQLAELKLYAENTADRTDDYGKGLRAAYSVAVGVLEPDPTLDALVKAARSEIDFRVGGCLPNTPNKAGRSSVCDNTASGLKHPSSPELAAVETPQKDTVEALRQRVIQRMRVPTVTNYGSTKAAQVDLDAVDALVAAVRAEEQERHGETVIAFEGHGIAPDEVVDGFSYAADVVRKKIAAVRGETPQQSEGTERLRATPSPSSAPASLTNAAKPEAEVMQCEEIIGVAGERVRCVLDADHLGAHGSGTILWTTPEVK